MNSGSELVLSQTLKRKRCNNFSEDETHMLAQLWAEHEKRLTGSFTPTFTKQDKDKIWAEIVNKVNLVRGGTRTLQEIKNKIKNMRTTVKEKAMNNKRQYIRTGGGPSEEVPLTETETFIFSTIKDVEIDGISDGLDLSVVVGKQRFIDKV